MMLVTVFTVLWLNFRVSGREPCCLYWEAVTAVLYKVVQI